MATRLPTILATSGGFAESARLRWEVGPLTRFAVELAGVIGRAPELLLGVTVNFELTGHQHTHLVGQQLSSR